ncbi:hypothetical protein CR513_30378, partial [Mucuna pruriens]
MKMFPFSLDGATKDWLYLQSVIFNTWGDMKRMFLEKFFLASKTATIRKEICEINLHEYWERFNKLCATCPHYQISEKLLIQYFCEATSARAESRAICSLVIWTCPKCTLGTRRLSTTDSTILGAIVLAIAITENASSRKFTISGGPDEAISNKQSGVLANHELQQYAVSAEYERHHPRPQDSAGSNNLPSQTIPNPRGNASAVTLRSGKALPQPTPQQFPRSADADFELDANSQRPQQDKTVPLPFPTRTLSA